MKRPFLVFDLDDTLFLERDYVRGGLAAAGAWARRHLGIADLEERAWRLFEEGRRGDLFDAVLGDRRSRAVVEELVRAYRRHTPRIALAPDAARLLARFRHQVPMALITDGPFRPQRSKVAALALDNWLDPLVLTGRWGARFAKPHPRAFEHVERWAGAPYRFVYLADNPDKDFDAPRKLGWLTVRVRRREGLHFREPNRKECPPDAEILSFDEWRAIE